MEAAERPLEAPADRSHARPYDRRERHRRVVITAPSRRAATHEVHAPLSCSTNLPRRPCHRATGKERESTVAPVASRPVQLRDPSPLTSEAYVAQCAWQCASLAHCPRHARGGCGFARHGTYRRTTPAGMRIARYYCPTAH